MSLAETLNSLLPDEWHITHIIDLEPGWQVSLFNGEYIVVATGDSIETAIEAAVEKTYDESKYSGRWVGLAKLRTTNEPPEVVGSSLLERLGLLQKPEPIKRRI